MESREALEVAGGCLVQIFVRLNQWSKALAGLDAGFSPPDRINLLAWACVQNKASAVRKLLSKGMDPNGPDANGLTCLNLLARRHDKHVSHHIINSLIRAGGQFAPRDPNCTDEALAASPLGSVLTNFDGPMMDTLRDPQTPDILFNLPTAVLSRALFLAVAQPIHLSCEREWLPNAKSPIWWLLRSGADPNKRDDEGNTPFMKLVKRFSPETNEVDLYMYFTLSETRDQKCLLAYWRDFLECPEVDLMDVLDAKGMSTNHYLDLLLNQNGTTGAHIWLRQSVIRIVRSISPLARPGLPHVLSDKENHDRLKERWRSGERTRLRRRGGL